MGHWEFEHSAKSEAPPTAVWERYTDVENWKEWSPKGVEESSLDGRFEAGSTGESKAPHLPKGKFELVEVETDRRFVSRARFPGGSLTFEHMLQPSGGGTRITHKASIDGPLSFLWHPVIGRIVKRGLPSSVERLAELAPEKERVAEREAKEQEEKEERLKKADKEFKEEIEKTAHGEDRGGASLPGSG